jgi:tetratricopeptide (TPR) repeat protein
MRAALLCSATLLVDAPARACGWSWETYAAEGQSLPCVYDAVLGYFPQHSREYHETVIQAVSYAQAWAPSWTAGLDAAALSHLHLKQLKEAEALMQLRFETAPEAYASHANLGTLHTFSGQFGTALVHVDRAMSIEPKAHFGREKYHRKLVVFLAAVQREPDHALRHDFLGVELDSKARLNGSEEAFKARGFEDDAFDAVVSMIAVYGAENLAELYLTLGELLALRGHSKLAFSAYQRALELKHVRRAELKTWVAEMASYAASKRARKQGPRYEMSRDRGLPYADLRVDAERARRFYATWEKQQIKSGLPVWTQAGLDVLYSQMNRIRVRCRTPSVIDQLPPLDNESALLEPQHEVLPCPLCPWEARAQSVYGNAVVAVDAGSGREAR